VDAYVQAARGLSAAHGCGVVHRDFKPANVLVGEDEIVRVTDLGLARGSGCQLEITAAMPSAPQELTQTTTGALIGTLAYMAPEQLEGREATAQADQFSLCGALWEALSGRRPFEGTTPEELLEAMRRGPPASVAPGVPRRVRVALRRGLALVPSQRHPSVGDLIAALSVASQRRRGVRAAVLTGLGVLAVVASVLAEPLLRPSPASGALEEHEASVPVSTLDPATREELRDRLAQTREVVREDGLGEGAQACERLLADVEARGDAVLQAETHIVCSDVQLAKGEIEQAGATLEAAYFQARAVGSDVVALEASTRRLLVALFEQGDYALAERWLAHAEAELEKTDDPRLTALTARAAASLRAFQGDIDRAFEAVERGVEAARSGGLERLEILLLEEQANLLRAQLRPDEALVLYEQLARRVDALNADPLDTLSVHIGLGRTLVEAGFFEEGLTQLDRTAVVLASSREHGDRVWTAEVADLRGDALQHLGRLTEARAAQLECIRILEDTGGAFIPIALMCQTEVFVLDALLGRCETIASDLDRHVDALAHRLGADHPDTSQARVWNGYCRLSTGQIDHGRSELHVVLDAFADRPEAPSARLARALLDAEHWGLPVQSALDRSGGLNG
jgi:eukaryotic-like serine/threonine-protein kinase